jgi:hypothetical protein
MDILTKGNVIVNKIKVGDIHWEYDWGSCIKSTVITKPEINKDGNWIWESKEAVTGKTINYLVNPNYPSCYAVNLYDYPAYN